MIYLQLFWEFLKIGLFSFGGAYSAIPLIRDCIRTTGWMSEQTLSNILAISESTPGPIMVNTATYIGGTQGGVLGAMIATFAVIAPAFLLILLVMIRLKRYIKTPFVQSLLSGIIPCVIALILSTGLFLLINETIHSSNSIRVDFTSLLVCVFLLLIHFIFKYLVKKPLSPIVFILISAILGAVLF